MALISKTILFVVLFVLNLIYGGGVKPWMRGGAHTFADSHMCLVNHQRTTTDTAKSSNVSLDRDDVSSTRRGHWNSAERSAAWRLRLLAFTLYGCTAWRVTRTTSDIYRFVSWGVSLGNVRSLDAPLVVAAMIPNTYLRRKTFKPYNTHGFAIPLGQSSTDLPRLLLLMQYLKRYAKTYAMDKWDLLQCGCTGYQVMSKNHKYLWVQYDSSARHLKYHTILHKRNTVCLFAAKATCGFENNKRVSHWQTKHFWSGKLELACKLPKIRSNISTTIMQLFLEPDRGGGSTSSNNRWRSIIYAFTTNLIVHNTVNCLKAQLCTHATHHWVMVVLGPVCFLFESIPLPNVRMQDSDNLRQDTAIRDTISPCRVVIFVRNCTSNLCAELT